MNRRLVGLLVCLLLWIGAHASSVKILKQIDDTVACNHWVEEQLARMTLKQKIGQLFIHTVAPITTQKIRVASKVPLKNMALGACFFRKVSWRSRYNSQTRLSSGPIFP